MILPHHIPPASPFFPVDQIVLRTAAPFKPVVGNCLPNKLETLPPEIRTIIHSITARAKPEFSPGVYGKKAKRYNPTRATRTIHIDGFDGIKVQATEDPHDGWLAHAIIFNPGKVYNGHNGRILSEEEFLHATSILIALLKPLLEDERDEIHLFPGLHEHGRAWVQSIEVPLHTLDPNGDILQAFGTAKHKEINLKPSYRWHGESILFTNSTGNLVIRIYRKDIEMKRQRRFRVSTDQAVLRVEVRLQGDKLEEHFVGGTWQIINDVKRLVSFRFIDLETSHQSVMSKFDGLVSKVPDPNGEYDNKIGRFMGWVSSVSDLTFQRQFEYYSRRFMASNVEDSTKKAKSSYHIAARKELALLSPVAIADLFSDKAWSHQPSVICAQLEAMTQARHRDIRIHPLVEAAYSSQPIGTYPTLSSNVGTKHQV
jgi:hypothetical protein